MSAKSNEKNRVDEGDGGPRGVEEGLSDEVAPDGERRLREIKEGNV